MKKIKIIILSIIVLTLSVIQLTHAQNSQTRKVGSFHGVKAGQGIDVYLKQGSSEEVKVEAKGIDLRKVLTDVSGGRLKIHLENGRYRNHSVKVYVTFVKLDNISASSAANITSQSVIKTDVLDLSVSSAGDIEIDVEANEIDASASSAGDIEIAGTTKYLEVSSSSAGGVDAYDLKANKVYARSSSGGGIKVHAIDQIDARASSGGSIKYRGNPAKSRTDSGSGGSVRKSS